MSHTVKGFGVVNKPEVDVFLELSCIPNDPVDVGNLISDSSAFSKTSLKIWKFMVQLLLKLSLGYFKHYFTSVWDECNCVAVWAFFGIAFLRDWNENWPFPVLWPLPNFPSFLAYWVQHFHSMFVVVLPKAHLTSHSWISGSTWVIISLFLSESWRSFLYSSVYFCHVFLITSGSVRYIPFLSFIEPIFAWNVHLVSLIFLIILNIT